MSPILCSSQWTMEWTIGNLGQEIDQPSNLFANLSQWALQCCQVNVLKAMIPDLEKSAPTVPQGGKDLGGGYILLWAKDRVSQAMQDCKERALVTYLRNTHNLPTDEDWSPKVTCWARLHLPNGQVERSSWKESLKPLGKIWMACNIKVRISLNVTTTKQFANLFHQFSLGQELQFAEVYYYFCIHLESSKKTLALVLLYSPPHEELLKLSHFTLWSCSHHSNESLMVIDMKSILSVDAMVPHQLFPGREHFFVVEKPGLDVASLRGVLEDVQDDDE
jgi:hypothetical protein